MGEINIKHELEDPEASNWDGEEVRKNILPGGMVDTTLRELGGVIKKVKKVEDKELPNDQTSVNKDPAVEDSRDKNHDEVIITEDDN
jgi:hypothetical protein